MQQYTVKDSYGNTWQRVNKHNAKQVFDTGESIVICAHKLNPFGAWHCGVHINKEEGYTFEQWITNYDAYNCNYETGYYPAFYLKV